MFGLIKKMFIRLLTGLINRTCHTKCISLSNQKCMAQPFLINLDPNEYNQEFHYCPFVVKLDRYVAISLMNYLIKYVFQTKQKI